MLRSIIFVAISLAAVQAPAQEPRQNRSRSSQDRPSTQVPMHQHLADYDSELRLPNGRVDTDAMVNRAQGARGHPRTTGSFGTQLRTGTT